MKRLLMLSVVVAAVSAAFAQVATSLRPLHVEGRHLVDDEGNCMVMRGVMYGPHPYFNNGAWGSGWSDASVKKCLAYFDKVFTALTDTTQGSYCNMWRVPWEAYWCVKPDMAYSGTDTSTWDEAMALKYLDKLFIPLIENAISKGLYVVLRPCYGNPGEIQVGDDYQKHICHEWHLLASHPRLQALSGYVSFELLNEPTVILDENGRESDAALTRYMQPMVDTIRTAGFQGVIWSSGLAFQSKFQGYTKYPLTDQCTAEGCIDGRNLGYAVHIYPGWFCQNDQNADGERMLASFNHNVPVVDEAPICITEVDWSPEKEGEGRYNEFGEWIPSNWGSWGTGSTSKWGQAFKYMLEQNKNVSVAIGSADEYFDISRYLEDGIVVPWFDQEPECSAQAAFDWYSEWAHRPKETPAHRDRLPEEILGKTRLKTIDQLCNNYFEMVQGTDNIFYINAESMGGWDMLNGTAEDVVNGKDKAYLFKVHPVEVNGHICYTLKCYYPDGTLRLCGMDGGNADGVNITTGANPVLFIGSTRQNGPHLYGQDLDYGGLWDIQEKNDGFTFRSVSANNKYIGASGQSADAVVWKCYSRYAFWKNRDIPYQRQSEEEGWLHTVCVPYKAVFSGAEVYDVAGVDSRELPTKVYMNRLANGEQTVAGRAYVLRATTGQDINATMAASSVCLTPRAGNALTGVFTAQQAAAGSFVLKGGLWQQVSEDSDIVLQPYQASLNLANAEEVGQGDLVIDIDGPITGINYISGHSGKVAGDSAVYDLQGHRFEVGQMGHGVYIANGKKFIKR